MKRIAGGGLGEGTRDPTGNSNPPKSVGERAADHQPWQNDSRRRRASNWLRSSARAVASRSPVAMLRRLSVRTLPTTSQREKTHRDTSPDGRTASFPLAHAPHSASAVGSLPPAPRPTARTWSTR